MKTENYNFIKDLQLICKSYFRPLKYGKELLENKTIPLTLLFSNLLVLSIICIMLILPFFEEFQAGIGLILLLSFEISFLELNIFLKILIIYLVYFFSLGYHILMFSMASYLSLYLFGIKESFSEILRNLYILISINSFFLIIILLIITLGLPQIAVLYLVYFFIFIPLILHKKYKLSILKAFLLGIPVILIHGILSNILGIIIV